MPMNTPKAKNAVVACCRHSQGWPMVRVTTSRKTHRVKPPMHTPHRTINPASSGSSRFHFRWRWRWRISARLAVKSVTAVTCLSLWREAWRRCPRRRAASYRWDYCTARTRPRILTACGPSSLASSSWMGRAAFMNPDLSTLELILTPIFRSFVAESASSLKAMAGSRRLTSSAASWIHFFSSALKLFQALSLTQRQLLLASCWVMFSTGRHFVVLILLVHVDAVLGHVHHAGLERRVDLAEGHVHGLRAIGREVRVLGLGRLHAHLQALDVVHLADLLLAVHVAEAHRDQADDLGALRRVLDHGAERVGHGLVGQRPGQMVLVAEDEVQREHAGLRRHTSCVRGCRDDEVDVTRAQLRQRRRLGAQLRAGELIDAQLAATQHLELSVEYVGSDAGGRRHRLVVGEAELALRRGIARQP